MLAIRQEMNLLTPMLSGIEPEYQAALLEPESSVWGLTFDGTDDYINFADDLFESDNVGTIIARFKINATVSQNIIFATSVENVAQNLMQLFVFDIGGGDLRLTWQHFISGAGQNSVVYGDSSLNLVNEYHLAATQNGAALKLYVNGSEESLTPLADGNSGKWFNDLIIGNHKVNIGKRKRTADTHWAKGRARKISLFNKVLPKEEIVNDMNSIVDPNTVTGINLSARLNRGFGSSGAIIKDDSEANLTGTMNGFPANPWVNVGINAQ